MDLFLSICLALLAFATVLVNYLYNNYNKNKADDKKKDSSLSLIVIAIAILFITVFKGCREYKFKGDAKRVTDSLQGSLNRLDSTNKGVTLSLGNSQNTLKAIKTSLDSIGLKVNEGGKVLVGDVQKFKATVLKINSQTNVTSINQKGGQTARDITNNH